MVRVIVPERKRYLVIPALSIVRTIREDRTLRRYNDENKTEKGDQPRIPDTQQCDRCLYTYHDETTADVQRPAGGTRIHRPARSES